MQTQYNTPSVRGIRHNNFAFISEKGISSLTPIGVRFCIVNDTTKNFTTPTSIIADGYWNYDLNKFEWYSPFSDKSKETYSDILLSVMLSK